MRSPRRGAERLTILLTERSGLYERNGAVWIGEAPSDAVPGRLLPLYEVRLNPAGASVDLGLTDPSVESASVVVGQVGEPAGPSG
jgi:hypothetical protein